MLNLRKGKYGMNILPVNYTYKAVRKELPSEYRKFDVQNDTFEQISSTAALSFGNAQKNLAKEIIGNPKLRGLFEEFTGNVAAKAFLSLFGIALGGKLAEETLKEIPKENNDVMSEILGLLNNENNEELNELETLKQENGRLKEENAQLRILLDNHEQGEESISNDNTYYEDGVSDDEVYVLGSKSGESKSESSEGSGETVQEEATSDEVTNEELSPVIFPKKHGRLSKTQEQLKSIVSEMNLPLEEGRKMTAICTVLLNKEYTTPSGKIIPCDGLANAIIQDLKKSEDCTKLIDKCYKILELGVDEDIKISNETDDTAQVVEETEAGQEETAAKYEDTYKQLKEHPLEQPKVLGTIDLSKLGRHSTARKPDSSTQEDKPVANGFTEEDGKQVQERTRRYLNWHPLLVPPDDDVNSVVSSDLIENPSEGLVVRLETTPVNPKILFPHYAIGNPVGLFNAPESFMADSPFKRYKVLRFKRETVGDMAAIIMNLENYYDTFRANDQRRENVRIWANNVIFPKEVPATEVDDSMKNITIRPQTVKYAAKNIQVMDVIQEIDSKSDEDYSNIKSAVYEETKNSSEHRFLQPQSQIFSEITDAINEDERFQYFSLHGAIRLVERLVDFQSDVSIKNQCTHILDRLFDLIEQALEIGVQVKTYMYTSRKTDKFDNIIVKIAPNVTIPKELYTEEDKKLFKNDDLIISLCEHQPGDDYVKSLKQPLIKTLVINNKW